MTSGFLDPLAFKLEGPTKQTVVLTRRLRYLAATGRVYEVPSGFRCDLASIPRIFRSVTIPWQQSARAGCVHDCGYRWWEIWGMHRHELDELYRLMLIDESAPRWRARMQKWAVRLGAGGAWERWRQVSIRYKGIMPGPPYKRARLSALS